MHSFSLDPGDFRDISQEVIDHIVRYMPYEYVTKVPRLFVTTSVSPVVRQSSIECCCREAISQRFDGKSCKIDFSYVTYFQDLFISYVINSLVLFYLPLVDKLQFEFERFYKILSKFKMKTKTNSFYQIYFIKLSVLRAPNKKN